MSSPDPSSGVVAIVGDTDFYMLPLSGIVREAGLAVQVVEHDGDPVERIAAMSPPPTAVIVNLTTLAFSGAAVLASLAARNLAPKPLIVCIDHLFERSDARLLAERGVDLVINKATTPAVIAAELKTLVFGEAVQVENRRDPRVATCFPLEFRSDGRVASGYCASLSLGGMYVLTRHPAGLGEEISMGLVLPGESAKLDLVGRVVYVSRAARSNLGSGPKSPRAWGSSSGISRRPSARPSRPTSTGS